MTVQADIQWFPGHMKKAEREMASRLSLVDAVAEVVDARIPMSSRNPDIKRIVGSKPRLVILNKCDMADQNATAEWISFFAKKGIPAIPVDCKSGKGVKKFGDAVKQLLRKKLEDNRAKGFVGRPLRVMVVGIPNVGKSTFINRIAGNNKAKAENRPGVTRGNQWYTVDRELELLDTPGVLWPKFEDKTVGENLAFTGAVRSAVFDCEALAVRLCERLSELCPDMLKERYKLDSLDQDSYELLCSIGRKRGFVIRGGETDTERTANMLLEEFRNCKIGQITLERVR